MNEELFERAEKAIDYHARMARHWDAKAAVFDHAENEDDVEKANRQKKSHLDAADTIRTMMRLLKGRANNKAFVPPTVLEVIAFAKDHEEIRGRWPVGDIKAWWRHFDSNGWLVSGKTKMRSWRSAALNGFKNWCERNPNRCGPKPGETDPPGWAEFLKGLKRDWVAYKYAPDYLRQDFKQGSD